VPIWRERLAGLDWLALRTSPVFYGCGVARGDGAGVVLVPGFLAPTGTCSSCTAGWRGWATARSSRASAATRSAWTSSPTACSRRWSARGETGRPAHVVGHSLGGDARALAGGAPARPRRLGGDARLAIPRHPLPPPRARGLTARARVAAGREPAGLLHRPLPLRGGARSRAPDPGVDPDARGVHAHRRHRGLAHVRRRRPGRHVEVPGTHVAGNVEVPGTHVALVANPAVYRALARHLADAGRPVSAATS